MSAPEDAATRAEGLWKAFGIGPDQLQELIRHLEDIVPISGVPEIEAPIAWGLAAGVLVGLHIADSATPLDAFGDLPLTSP